jgi:hypothetical protein
VGTFQEFCGNALRVTISGSDFTLSYFAARVWDLNVTGSGRSVLLPNATRIPTGGGHFDLFNTGTESVLLKDNSGTVTVATIPAGDTAKVILLDNSDADGDWRAKVVTTGSIPQPPDNRFVTTLGGNQTGDEAWAYDHTMDSWSMAMNTSANNHDSGQGFTSTTSGYAVAGSGTSSVDSYDPQAWTARTALSYSQADCDGDSSGGNGYTIGHTLFSADLSDNTNEYDIDGDSWSLVQEFPEAVVRFQTVQADDDENLWVMGGTPNTGGTWTGQTDNRIFEPGLDTYTSKTAIPTEARAQHGSFLLDSNIHILNGITASLGSLSDRNDEWDVSLESWTNRLDWPLADRRLGGSSSVSGNAYYTGGVGAAEYDDTREYTTLDTYVAKAAHGTSESIARGWRSTTLSIPI